MQDTAKREQAKQLVREAAWDTKRDCENCRGTGKVAGGELIVHSEAGGFGADWDLDAVLAAIDKAESVQWRHHIFHHELVVTAPSGRVIRFDVKQPAETEHMHSDDCNHVLGVLPVPGASTCSHCGDHHDRMEYCPMRCPVAYAALVELSKAGA